MVIINQNTCIGCTKCVPDCVAKNIEMRDSKAHIIGECIQCGHCTAICPVNAPSIPDYDMADVELYNEDTFHVNPEHLLHAIKFRRSIRRFKNQPVEDNKLMNILQAGRYTETAVNYQDVRFILVKDQLKEAKELIWEGWKVFAQSLIDQNNPRGEQFMSFYTTFKEDPSKDRLFFNAPSFIIVAADNPLNGGLASENMDTMAVAEGLGVLFDGYVTYGINASREAQEWLGIGDKKVISCLLIGYPDVTYARTAPRRKGDFIIK